MSLKLDSDIGENGMICPYVEECPLLERLILDGDVEKQYHGVCSRGEIIYTGCDQFIIEECGEK